MRLREHLLALGFRSYFVCVYDKPGDAAQARLVLSSELGSEPGAAPRAFRGRELLPSELASVKGVGRSFAVLPRLGQRALLGHVLCEYTAQHAFSCGSLADAIGIAIRSFAKS